MSVMHIMLYSISLYVDNHSSGIKKLFKQLLVMNLLVQ